MIIDCHTHLGSPSSILPGRAVDLIKSMDRAHIDKALVFAGRLNGISTQEVLEETKPFRDRLKVVASMSPSITYDGVSQFDPSLARELANHRDVVAMKFYPGYEHWYPSDNGMELALYIPLTSLAEAGKPAIFHSGDTFSKAGGAKLKYAMPIHLDDVAVNFPKLKIVIAHMGFPWVKEAAEVCYKNKNVYADVSGFVYDVFTPQDEKNFQDNVHEFLKIAGSEPKLLFGSDWPISNQTSYVQTCLNLFGGTMKESFLHGLAEELFNV